MDTYEKKYKEALERATKAKNNASLSNGTLRVLGIIFPELKESEEERIRKALICGMNALKANQKKKTFAAIPIDDCIAWLEKQGQKPTLRERYENIAKSEWFKRTHDGMSISDEESKWTEEDEENFRDIISAIHSVAYQTTEDEEARIEWLKSLKKRWRNNNE